MIRRIPLFPTILVTIAIAVMIGLGVWQLRRADWKAGVKQQYAAAQDLPPIAWPTTIPSEEDRPLFRHATGNCRGVEDLRASAGENAAGQSGYILIADCPGIAVELGWTRDPSFRPDWNGGLVSGVVAPDRKAGMRLVAATPPPGLQASKPPSLAAIPDNHRLYAVRWFFFAALAGLIYALALRRRNREAAA